jgi:acetyl-CoA carboxylase biotin carboxyl carrier protein
MLKIEDIREIIELIDQSSINEFTYESEGTTVSLSKSLQPITTHTNEKVVAPIEQVQVQEPSVLQPAANDVEQPASEEVSAYDYEIVSPMVGTIYAAPSPESDVFVKQGSKVANDTVVCIVEAMKLFNEIEAEVTGEIVEVLVEDGELVEYGQPLFRVKKN